MTSLDITAEQGAEDSIEKKLLDVDPFDEAIEKFEKLSWRKQQLILGRLALMEQIVSLKLLPLAMGLFTLLVGGVITWAIRSGIEDIAIAVGSLVSAAALFVLLPQMRKHRKQDARLNAWTAVLKASHALRTKTEEERWKHVPATTLPQLAPGNAQSTPQPAPGNAQSTHKASGRKP